MEIDVDVLDQWREVGAREGLETDTDIARFLLNQNRLPQGAVPPSTECQHCHAPLTLVCSVCGRPTCTQKDDLNLKLEFGVINKRIKFDGCDQVETSLNAKDCKKQDNSDTELADTSDETSSNEAVQNNSHETTLRIKMERSSSGRDASLETHSGISFTETVVEDVHSDSCTPEQQIVNVYNRVVPAATGTVYATDGCRRKETQADIGGRSKQRKKGKTKFSKPLSESAQVFGSLCGGPSNVASTSAAETDVVETESLLNKFQTSSLPDAEDFSESDSCSGKKSHSQNLQKASQKNGDQNVSAVITASKGVADSTCKICDESCSTPQDLQWHVASVHMKGNLYQCPKCDKTFTTRRYLECYHMVSHRLGANVSSLFKKDGVCNQCGKYVRRLKDHQKIHKVDRQHKCHVCTAAFKTRDSLRQHLECHATERKYECPYCQQRFRMRASFCGHMARHRKKEGHGEHTCTVCGSRQLSGIQLEVHMLEKHADQIQDIRDGSQGADDSSAPSSQDVSGSCQEADKSCASWLPSHTSSDESLDSQAQALHIADSTFEYSECGLDFVSYSLVKTHSGSREESKTVPEYSRQLLCQLCGAAFKRRDGLKDHLLGHANAKNFKCDKCEKAYNTRACLRQHKRLVHTRKDSSKRSETSTRFLCQLCGMSFKRKDSLKEHTQRHTNARNFKCSMCEKSYNTQGCLRQHVRHVHIGKEMRYKCLECGHLCFSPLHLKIHTRSHTGEKPFECPTCSKTFRSQNHLYQHKKVHESKKPYVCEVCEADFRDLRNLKLHMRKHTGEKPYQCKHCGEAFSWDSGLRWHMSKQHPV